MLLRLVLIELDNLLDRNSLDIRLLAPHFGEARDRLVRVVVFNDFLRRLFDLPRIGLAEFAHSLLSLDYVVILASSRAEPDLAARRLAGVLDSGLGWRRLTE